MGCPLTTEPMPLVMGDNRPYPNCHQWNERVMAKLVKDHPDFVFTTSTRPWNIKPGDVMPATYIGIWKTLTEHQIPVRDAGYPVVGPKRQAVPAGRLPGQGRRRSLVRHQALSGALRPKPDAGLRVPVPT